MGWFDRLAYQLAPLAGPIGKGIADYVQDLRTTDAARAYQNAGDLNQFAGVQTPDNIYSPEHLNALDKLKKDQLGILRKNDATEKLNALDANYRDIAGTSNLRFFADPDSRAEMVKAGLQVPDTSQNPELRSGLQQFTTRARNEDLLTDAFSQGQKGPVSPEVMASIASDPSLVKTFDDAARGSKTLFDMANYRDDKALDRQADAIKQADTAGFLSSVADLIKPAQSPLEMRRLKETGGYDPQGEADIYAAAAAYPGANQTTVGQALDNYRGTMEKTPVGDPYTKELRTGNATSKQMLQDYVLGGPKSVGGSVTNHPRQPSTAATGPTPKEIERQRRADLNKINDLKLKRSLVMVDKDFPEEGTAKRQAYDEMITVLEAQFAENYPGNGAAKAPAKGDLNNLKGDESRTIGVDKKGKPKILETKKLTVNGKEQTFYKIGPGERDWVDKRP